MTLQPYDSDDAVRQIRHADNMRSVAEGDDTMAVALAVSLHYLRACAVALAAIAARLEQG